MITTILKTLLAVFLSVAVIQIGAVYLLRFLRPDPVPADLVTILPSSKERIEAGCRVAAEQGTGYLMLINNTPEALKKHALKFEVPESLTLLPGGTSRSTFEDIHVTVQTARDRNLKSVMLVTSDYHLPRALFLLYVYNMATGHGLGIQYVAVRNKSRPFIRAYTLYSEIVKFWGSTAELSGYLLTSELPLDSDKVLAVRNTLKKVLLL